LIVKQGHHESSASIRFELAAPSDVVLSVYDVSGRLLSEIVRAAFPAGTHEHQWEDSRDGRRIPAGVYLVRLDTGRRTLVEKLIIAP
jgi:hypothetical protein